jgi:hypothetical protein
LLNFVFKCYLVFFYNEKGKSVIKLREVEDGGSLNVTSTSKLLDIFETAGITNKVNISKDNPFDSGFVFYGCKHYLRNCKILCPKCEKFYSCRVCHDKVSNHDLERHSVTHVFCYNCEEVVPIASTCVKCNSSFGCYYCDKCKLISGNPLQENYHCDECILIIIIYLL